MSASTGSSSKGEKGKSKYQSLDINSIYNSRSESSEVQTTKSTIPRKHGMQQLGKVPQRRPPANLPSLKAENSGNDPSISLVPTGGTGWGVKVGESQQLTSGGGATAGNAMSTAGPQNSSQTTGVQNQNSTSTSSPAPAAGAPPATGSSPVAPPPAQTSSHHDKTWSSITGGSQTTSLGLEHGPPFLAHQSPQFHQEFPSLSGEPGGAPAHPTTSSFGQGLSLRPQTEPGSWCQGAHTKPPSSTPPVNNIPAHYKNLVPAFLASQDTGFSMFPAGIQKRSRSQASSGHSENRMNRMLGGTNSAAGRAGGGNNSTENSKDLVHSTPIIKAEDLVKMDEITQDGSWAASCDIDYNEKLSFSDSEIIAEEDKENSSRHKLKQQPAPVSTSADSRKEESDKTNRDKPFMSERDRNQQPWRVGNNTYSDFRNTPRQLIPSGGSNRLDDDEMWKEKRRQTTEHKMAAAEKAKQRKEEEEKRYEESRAAASKKSSGQQQQNEISMSSASDWDKEDNRAKSSEHFRQMIQFPLEGRLNMNRERDRDRDTRRGGENQFSSNRFKPPRFRQKEPPSKPQQFGGGPFEKSSWNHSGSSSFNRRGGPLDDKEDEFFKDSVRHDNRPPPSDSAPPDRFRVNIRDDRIIDSSKRNYYDNSHSDYNQSSFQSDKDKETTANKDYEYRMSQDKESSGRDEKEWGEPQSKGDPLDSRNFEDRPRRDNKAIHGDGFPSKQSVEQFEEKETEWRDRPQRPESRDRPDRDLTRMERLESRDNRLEYRLDSRHDNTRSSDYSRHDSSRENRMEGNRHEIQSRGAVDLNLSDGRPPRPDSRDSKASRTSKDSMEKSCILDADYSLPPDNNIMLDKMERLTFKDPSKDMRREPPSTQRVRDHVPGPITPEKMVAYEHKHNQSQLEKSDAQEKESVEDKKMKKSNDMDSLSQAWGENHMRDDKIASPQQSIPHTELIIQTAQHDTPRADFLGEDNKIGKIEDVEKRKENGGGMKDRRDDTNKSMGGGGGRGNRSRGGTRSGGYSSASAGSNKYNMFNNPPNSWQNKDNRQNRSSRVRCKQWNQSESDGSGDEISAESNKDDKKTDRKQDCSSKYGTWKSDKERREDKRIGGSDSEKERGKGDKKQQQGGEGRKAGESGMAPRPTGEPSRRGRGGMRGQSRLSMGPAYYGPPGSQPFSTSSSQPPTNNPPPLSLSLDNSQDSKGHFSSSPPQHSSDNGFQEVKSKKTGGRGGGGLKEGSNDKAAGGGGRGSKGKDKTGGGGIKSQQKSYTREFVNKPPRMQRLDNSRKQQQLQQHDQVSDMNKINQSVSPLFPLARSNDVSCNSCPPPPAHNAWNKPINASLRTTPPLSTALTQLTASSSPPQQQHISADKTSVEDLAQPGNPVAQANTTVASAADKTIGKMPREVVVEKSILEGPPVNTIIFENTNYKRDPGEICMKSRFPMKGPTRTSLDKARDRKMEDELADGISLGGFKPPTELQPPDSKTQQDNIQVPISFGKNEDNADMKLDFAFDSELSQLSDDKTNQSSHVGQSSTADLNQKIASVKKVWDSPPGMSSHVDEAPTSSFTQGFTTDKSLDPTATSHHTDHSDFNPADSLYGGQLSSGGGYVTTGSSMMKADTMVSGANTMCKTNMFQMSAQPQQVTVMPPHPGPLSTPPPLTNVLSFPAGYSSNLSAVPSPPNVMYNSQQATQPEIYQAFSLPGTAQMHSSGNRSYCTADFPPPPSYSNSTFQASMYMQSGPPQSVFQNPPTPYRMHSSNPSTMLMSSNSSTAVVSGTKSTQQGSIQPAGTIGSKSAPPTAAFPPPNSTQFLVIEPAFIHQSYHHRQAAALQHTSSFFNSTLTPGGGSTASGLFNSASLLGGGGGGGAATTAPPTASPFGVQQAASAYGQQQPPPSSNQPYPSAQQPQIPAAAFRTQSSAGYPKGPPQQQQQQHPSQDVKSSSSSQDQFQTMFQATVQGSSKGSRMSVVKPQPSGSPQPQQHKFSSYNTNAHSVSQANLSYQQSAAVSNGATRQQQQQQAGMRGGGSGMSQVPQQQRYISPIQRPLGPPSYTQQQQAVMMQQQQQARQHRTMQQQQMAAAVRAQQHSQQPKQYYSQQQGGGMKLDNDSVKNDVDEQNKACQDKSGKDEQTSDQ